MGMAVMLDVIINYVQSLQNQIEVSCVQGIRLIMDMQNEKRAFNMLFSCSFFSWFQFLSMKLSAASTFYDFNSSEAEALETMQVYFL